MPDKLTIKEKNIKEGDSHYCWVNIEVEGNRVGKARMKLPAASCGVSKRNCAEANPPSP